MSLHHYKHAEPHACAISSMTVAEKAKVEGSLMQADTRLPTALETLEPFHSLAQPGYRLLDRFSDRIEFDTLTKIATTSAAT